jgi:hypothetical protein
MFKKPTVFLKELAKEPNSSRWVLWFFEKHDFQVKKHGSFGFENRR